MTLKKWFVFVMTLLFILLVFALTDLVVAGLIAITVSVFWGLAGAIQVFKWVVFTFYAIEFIFTIPIGISCYKKEIE